MNPFDFIKSINTTKKNLMDEDPSCEKSFDPFVTNRNFSYFMDTLGAANEMNSNHWLDKRMQYEYYLNNIRSRSRYTKWAKREKEDDLEMVKEYYQCNTVRAREAIALLSDANLADMKAKMQKGGKSK